MIVRPSRIPRSHLSKQFGNPIDSQIHLDSDGRAEPLEWESDANGPLVVGGVFWFDPAVPLRRHGSDSAASFQFRNLVIAPSYLSLALRRM